MSCAAVTFFHGNRSLVLLAGCSVDVLTLAANIASVVQSSGVHHGEAVVDALPDASSYVLAVLNGVLFHLFDVLLLGCAITATDAFVVSSFKRITGLENSKERLLLNILLFLWERNISAVGSESGIEGASLADGIGPWLVTVDNASVLHSVFVTAVILLVLPRIFGVSHSVQTRERFGLDTSCEARSTLRYTTLERSLRNVLELRLANLLVGGRQERLLGLRGASTETTVIFSRVLIWITKGVGLEFAESRLGLLFREHTAVEADFIALLTVGLVVSARVADSQTDWHGEKSITLPTKMSKSEM